MIPRRRWRAAVRRGIDVVGGGVLLLVAGPVLAVCALLVLLDSGRPVFFGHQRLGQGGRRFRCWKLRTMVTDAEVRLNGDRRLRERYESNGYKLPVEEDPRVTAVGRWLRQTYLDELPQLVNVVNGSMSLVGPRPIVPDEIIEWGELADELLRVKPGVTGAWTSRGRRRPAYPERARLEIDYLRRRSLRSDATILLRTAAILLSGQRAP